MSTTRRRRPALILLVVVAAAGCLGLAWWQWTRYESTSGTFQNLGYALQWPMFAAFCFYAYYKFVRYEEAPPERPEAGDPAPVPSQAETIRKALLGYRVMAWTTGIWLIALCYEMVLKYIVKVEDPPSWIGIVHGWVYFVYLLFTANLALKVRWPIGK